MNLLSYVHLRNIYRSTGVGRVARELTQNLALQPDIRMEVLADRKDHDRVIAQVGGPWLDFPYHFIAHDTSRQQAIWFLTNRPKAEDYWSKVDVVHCTAESYVPGAQSASCCFVSRCAALRAWSSQIDSVAYAPAIEMEAAV